MDLDLLLVHADDRRPALDDGLPGNAAFAAPKPQLSQRDVLRDRGGDLDDLGLQKWAVVLPDTPRGTRLAEIIEPLCRLRQEEQGGVPIQKYRVKPGMTTAEAITWRRTVYEDGSVDESEWPYYLLILGDFDGVSLAFQEVMGAECVVGRITFGSDAGYESYAAKVKRWQEKPYTDAAARALVYTARDGTAATTIGYRSLMQPSLEVFRKRAAAGAMKVKDIVEVGGEEPTAGAFIEELRRAEPALLFSMCHGLGAPRGGYKSVDQQRALQGAMSLGEGNVLTGADAASGAFLPGGVWFFLACFGAGTPRVSAYHEWLRRLRANDAYSGRLDAVLASLPKSGEPPFVSALPQAALANPDGPLAIMSHVDLAWTFSFQDAGSSSINRASRFQGIFKNLLLRRRVGVAHREILLAGVQTAVDLSTKYGEDEEPSGGAAAPEQAAAKTVERANLWMLRHDLMGYILLGDPAVRLPLSTGARPASGLASAAEGRAPAAPPKRDLSAAFGFAVKAPARSGEVLDVATMDKAVREALRQSSPLADVARQFGVSEDALKRWVDVFTKAGKEALSKLR